MKTVDNWDIQDLYIVGLFSTQTDPWIDVKSILSNTSKIVSAFLPNVRVTETRLEISSIEKLS